MTTATAYRVQVTSRDGTVTLSPRTTFKSIAASGAVMLRREPNVASAIVIEA